MKKEKRVVYIALGEEIGAGIGQFCKYAEYCSNGSICDEGEVWLDKCNHPLEDRCYPFDNSFYDDTCECPGCDCWLFRPLRKLNDLVDIVGIILANHWNAWGWYEEEGQLYVYGANRDI